MNIFLRFICATLLLLSAMTGYGYPKAMPEGAVKIGDYVWYSILSEENRTAVCVGIDYDDWVDALEEYMEMHIDIPAYVKFPDHGEAEYRVVEIGSDAFYALAPLAGYHPTDDLRLDYGKTDWWCMVRSLTIPETVTKIGDYAFCGAGTGFWEFHFNESVTEIGSGCFCDSFGVVSMYLPESLKKIPDYFTSQCKYMEKCDIPAEVEEIGKSAFFRCNSLERVYIPASVKRIGKDAFTALLSIENFEVDPDNENFCAPDGILLDKERKTLIAWPFKRTKVIVPEGVETIQGNPLNWAFELFKTIDLPSTMKSLPAGCFGHDTHLKKIIVRAEVPPVCGENEYVSFADPNVFNNAKLYVPAGSEEAYRAAPVWKEFRNILAIGSDAVEGVSADPDTTEAEYFTLDGRKTESPAEGEIVIRRQNGKSTAIIR